MVNLTPKPLRALHHVKEHNWLIHALIIDFLSDAAARHASGVLVDIGCGAKPYQKLFAPFVSEYIGVDLADTPHGISNVDVIGTAYETTLDAASCDVVLCTEVLEHLERPQAAVQEMNRILRPSGIVILTVPFFWPIHEAPRDFYRYSEYGLKHLFKEADFEIIEIRPLSGYVATFTQLSIYFLKRFQRGPVLRTVGRLCNWSLQHLALSLNRYDGSTQFTNLYGLIARKARVLPE